MGSGYWSADVYETAERLRKGKSAFTYSDSAIDLAAGLADLPPGSVLR